MTIDEIRIMMAEADKRVEHHRASINDLLLFPLLKKTCALIEEKQRLLRCKKAREDWKIFYRQLRVARRESWKATMDTIIYGSGMVRITEAGIPEHVPFSEQYLFDGLTAVELADELL